MRLEALEQLVMAHEERFTRHYSPSIIASCSPLDSGAESDTVLINVQPQYIDVGEDTDEADGMGISLVDEQDRGYFGTRH